MRPQRAIRKQALITWLLVAVAAAGAVWAQVPGGCNTPVSQRTSEAGCYLTATEALGALPQGPLFWHLYLYPTRAAAEAAKGQRGTVVESFEKVWLYTIAESELRAASVGTETRRSVLLVLHDTSQPWITMASDWKPKGVCPK